MQHEQFGNESCQLRVLEINAGKGRKEKPTSSLFYSYGWLILPVLLAEGKFARDGF